MLQCIIVKNKTMSPKQHSCYTAMYNSKKENNDERWSLSLGSSRGKQAVSLPFSVNWKTSQ